jgi:hypothetical protein
MGTFKRNKTISLELALLNVMIDYSSENKSDPKPIKVQKTWGKWGTSKYDTIETRNFADIASAVAWIEE